MSLRAIQNGWLRPEAAANPSVDLIEDGERQGASPMALTFT